MPNRTIEEIERLKANWLNDPCWDIEDTDGFQEYREELLKFHIETQKIWNMQYEDEIARRARVVLVETGISNSSLAQEIHTYSEIEKTVETQTSLAQAQIRATLLLAAQVQRVADVLEDMGDGASLAESVKIWRTGK